jgi:hypothetical protein
MFRHVVLFRVRDDVAEESVSVAIDELRALGNSPGVVTWVIARSLDERKGRVIAEDGTFIDRAAFHTWRMTAYHRVVASRMAGLADWLIGEWDDEKQPALDADSKEHDE